MDEGEVKQDKQHCMFRAGEACSSIVKKIMSRKKNKTLVCANDDTHCLEFLMKWDEECKKAARALPKEKRQEFIDCMWAGGTIGENKKKCKLTDEETHGIMMLNMFETTHLRTESV